MFIIPVPLAALVLVVALTAKAVKRGCSHRSMRPNATCAGLLAMACACALVSMVVHCKPLRDHVQMTSARRGRGFNFADKQY